MNPEFIVMIVALASIFATVGLLVWAIRAALQWVIGTANEFLDIWKDTE